MNLFLTSACNERCPFCYAETYFQSARDKPPRDGGDLFAYIRLYGKLVHRAQPPPPYSPKLDEETRTLFSARTVNLLGGEPTLHPSFERVVEEISGNGLAAIVFTNASRPEKIRAVAHRLATVVVNGHFADRATDFGIEPFRIHANLPIEPGLDVVAALRKIYDSGIRTVYLAFAAPAGGNNGSYFTPLDLEAMKRVHQAAMKYCRVQGMTVAYDCSFPVCVDPNILQAKCTSVPVMDPNGYITICGGEYFHEDGKRHISTFDDYREIHRYTFHLISRLRALPSRFEVCNGCEYFNRECHGMCLGFRKPAVEPLHELATLAE